MPDNDSMQLIWRFAYRHFETDGKLENILEAINAVDEQQIALALFDPLLDGDNPPIQLVEERLSRGESVLKKLRRREIRADLILPGLRCFRSTNKKYRQLIKHLYARAGRICPDTIWVDDRGDCKVQRADRREILSWFGAIERAVHEQRKQARLGLLAGYPQRYARWHISAGEAAKRLAGEHDPLFLQQQAFTSDYQRTDILHVARMLCLCRAYNHLTGAEIGGYIGHTTSSGFDKSAEAEQMQIIINMIFGNKTLMIDCFDLLGTAPGTENLYLQLINNRRRFLRKLSRLLGAMQEGFCIRVVVPDITRKSSKRAGFAPDMNNWPVWLWRMGLTADYINAADIQPSASCDGIYILAGDSPRYLNRRQLQHIFRNGVFLDGQALRTIREMPLPDITDMTGVQVQGSLENVQAEILSDQTFAAPYYGHRMLLTADDVSGPIMDFQPCHPHARSVTMLMQKGRPIRASGMVLFDNMEQHQRCAVIPYSFAPSDRICFLSAQRQRLLRDVFSWLLRRRLGCFVENTPDLVPFWLIHPRRKRALLILLNVGFDWAIDSRIRLGTMPFETKRIRALNEQGKYEDVPSNHLVKIRGYRYIQLDADLAVPPMQTTVLVLDG